MLGALLFPVRSTPLGSQRQGRHWLNSTSRRACAQTFVEKLRVENSTNNTTT